MVTIFATKTCVWCTMVEKYLQSKKVEFQKVFVDDDRDKRDELFKMTGVMSVPITVSGDRYVIGWNPSKLSELIQTI